MPTDTLVTYRDEPGRTLPGKSGAKYLVKTVRTDSVAGAEWVYTLDGILHEHSQFASLRTHILHGVQEEYYPKSRQIKLSSTYQNGQLSGELLSFYPNGQLKRRERYLDYVSQGGECFDEAGAPLPFVSYFVRPEFEGGVPQLMSYLQQNIHYPAAELRARHAGRVLVRFVVNTTGRVTDPLILESVSPLLDAEALRVVRGMPRWKPGMVDGEIRKISFTLPVSFAIQ